MLFTGLDWGYVVNLPGHWAALSREDVVQLPRDTVAVLPLGATEQHGPHLPLGVDTILVNSVIERALVVLADGAPILAVPPLTVTKSDEHAAWAGTLALSTQTMFSVLNDIASSVARAGVQRLFLLNGHGGNTALLEIVVRDLRRRHRLITGHASWFAFADLSGWSPAALNEDLHGGDLETSAMLAAAPTLVEMEYAQNFQTSQHEWAGRSPMIGLSGQPVRPGWLADDLSATGAMGNAAVASAEKGKALLDSAARGLAEALEQFRRFELAPEHSHE